MTLEELAKLPSVHICMRLTECKRAMERSTDRCVICHECVVQNPKQAVAAAMDGAPTLCFMCFERGIEEKILEPPTIGELMDALMRAATLIPSGGESN